MLSSVEKLQCTWDPCIQCILKVVECTVLPDSPHPSTRCPHQDRITVDGRFVSSSLPASQVEEEVAPMAGVPSTAPQVPPISEQVPGFCRIILLPDFSGIGIRHRWRLH